MRSVGAPYAIFDRRSGPTAKNAEKKSKYKLSICMKPRAAKKKQNFVARGGNLFHIGLVISVTWWLFLQDRNNLLAETVCFCGVKLEALRDSEQDYHDRK